MEGSGSHRFGSARSGPPGPQASSRPSRMASRAKKDRDTLQGWIQRLAKTGRSKRKTPHDRRATATNQTIVQSFEVSPAIPIDIDPVVSMLTKTSMERTSVLNVSGLS